MRREVTWLCELQRVRCAGTSQEERLLVIGRGRAGGSTPLVFSEPVPFPLP